MRLLLLALVALAQPAPQAAPHAPEMIPEDAIEVLGKPAPPINLNLKDGGTFDLSAHKGRVVVVSFWASWCGPCRNEMPVMNETAKTRKDIDWIAINVDRSQGPGLKFLEQIGEFGLPIAWDNEGLALGDYGVASMPTTFVIDRQGNVAYRKVGFSTERKLTELMAEVDKAVRSK